MKRYAFRLYLIGLGDDVDEAWRDAVEATTLDNDPPPMDFTVEDEEEEDE